MRRVGFPVTFLAAWFVLDRLATSPPRPVVALLALLSAGLVLAIGEVAVLGTPAGALVRVLGLTATNAWALLAAGLVGMGVVAVFLGGAAVLRIDLEWRANWLAVLIGLLLFHGVAEELVWRGFVLGHFRRLMNLPRAVAASMPWIALTHVPIVVGSGWLVGSLAMLSAAITCLPLAYLWERGGRTIWAPAVMHGLIGTWQLSSAPSRRPSNSSS